MGCQPDSLHSGMVTMIDPGQSLYLGTSGTAASSHPSASEVGEFRKLEELRVDACTTIARLLLMQRQVSAFEFPPGPRWLAQLMMFRQN